MSRLEAIMNCVGDPSSIANRGVIQSAEVLCVRDMESERRYLREQHYYDLHHYRHIHQHQ